MDSEDEVWVPRGIKEEDLDDTIAYFKNHPLFIKEVPENLADNPDLEALSTIMYDDTPENIAHNCNVLVIYIFIIIT